MSSNSNPTLGKTSKIRTFAIFALLVILPLGSWMYLKAGFNYYKSAMEELKDYGALPAFSFINQNGEQVTEAAVEDKLVVMGFLSKNSQYQEELKSYISKLHQQFKDSDDVAFLIYDTDGVSQEALRSVADQYALKDDKQCLFLSGDPTALQTFLGKGIKIPKTVEDIDEEKGYEMLAVSNTQLSNYPYLVFIDGKSRIRNYYALDNSRSIARLVEHMALLLPRSTSRAKEIQ